MSRLGRFVEAVREQGWIASFLRTRYVRPWIKRANEIVYWHDYTWTTTRWMGVPAMKYPADAWTYQEIVYDTAPDLIIETGTFCGGSALFFATLFDFLGKGRLITVDFQAREGRPVHPRIEYINGSSVSNEVMDHLTKSAAGSERVMVILDSDHSEAHVAKELELYQGFVTEGCYLVVEDTNVNGHPVYRKHGPGPMEALIPFMVKHPEFQMDETRERLGLTAHPKGFLKRISASRPKLVRDAPVEFATTQDAARASR